MITDDPHFAAGPKGDHYLCQLDAGQAVQSPCVDTGDFAGTAVTGTTRTDGMEDSGDRRYGVPLPRFRSEPDTFITSGPEWQVELAGDHLHLFRPGPTRASTEGLRYSWKVDDRKTGVRVPPRTAPSSPTSTAGAHTFSVRARDREGRIDVTAAVRTFFLEEWEPGRGVGQLRHRPGPRRSSIRPWSAPPKPSGWPTASCAGGSTWPAATSTAARPGRWSPVRDPGRSSAPTSAAGPCPARPLPGAVSWPTAPTATVSTWRPATSTATDSMKSSPAPGPAPSSAPMFVASTMTGPAWSRRCPGSASWPTARCATGVEVACGDIDGDDIDEIVTGAGPGDDVRRTRAGLEP